MWSSFILHLYDQAWKSSRYRDDRIFNFANHATTFSVIKLVQSLVLFTSFWIPARMSAAFTQIQFNSGLKTLRFLETIAITACCASGCWDHSNIITRLQVEGNCNQKPPRINNSKYAWFIFFADARVSAENNSEINGSKWK